MVADQGLDLQLSVSEGQAIFLSQLNTPHKGFVGGMGTGKTAVSCFDMLLYMLQNPGAICAYYEPTYAMIRDIFYPTIDKIAELMGMRTTIRFADKEVHVYIGSAYLGVILCRSLDTPESISGYEVEKSNIDELDLLSRDKAENVWNRIIARNRRVRDHVVGVPNQTSVTTTPEGFKFVYEKFKQNPTKRFSMVQCSTYSNAHNLPHDYIDTLKENYPKQMIEAYLMGEFVNLTSGTVYYAYDRQKCASKEYLTAADLDVLHIGMDFNVQKQAAVVFVQRKGIFHAVKQFTNMFDTPAAIKTIRNNFPTNRIVVYPDASGAARKSVDASKSDLELLRQAGFTVIVDSRNPAIKDRVLAVNAALEKGKVKVNAGLCRDWATALEQQAYDGNGMPQKDDKNEHINDAAGYFITQRFPVIKPSGGNIEVLR